MTGIIAFESLRFLYPWPFDRSGCGISYTLRITVLTPTRPQHTKLTSFCSEHFRTVGNPSRHLQTKSGFTYSVHLFGPCSLTGTEDGGWLSGSMSQIF